MAILIRILDLESIISWRDICAFKLLSLLAKITQQNSKKKYIQKITHIKSLSLSHLMLGGVLHLATILAIRRGNEKTQESACVRCYMAQQNNEQLSDIS